MKANESAIIKKLFHFFTHLVFRLNHWNVTVAKPNRSLTFYSDAGQDVYLASLLFNIIEHSQHSNVIIDCNQGHPVEGSLSYFFEKYFNCKTIAFIEKDDIIDHWRVYRPGASLVVNSLLENPPLMRDDQTDLTSSQDLAEVLIQNQIKEILIYFDKRCRGLSSLNFAEHKIHCFVISLSDGPLCPAFNYSKYLIDRDYIFHSRIEGKCDIFIHKALVGQMV